MDNCVWCNLSEEDKQFQVYESRSWSVFLSDEQDHNAALAVYTSGTTGAPKGALHEYGNFKLNMATRKSGGNDKKQTEVRSAFIAPLNFVAFYKNLVSAIALGMHLFIVSYATVKNPVLLRRYYKENRITETFLSPSLIRNQPVLQSVVRIDPDVCFVQHYDTSLEPELAIEHLTEKDVEEIKDDLIQPFIMINRLIYRIRIFETEEHVYVFLDLHHLFNDGTSMNILIRNFSDAYNDRQLPPDRAYLFARDSNKWILTNEYEDAKNRMLEKYGKKDWCRCITPDLESRSMRCTSVSCDFPADQKALTAFLETNALSLNELGVMAALMTLHEYEQKDDIMVSWAYSGRDQVIFKDTVFPITKEFPVAVSFDQSMTVHDLLKETKEQIRLGVECQMYPYIFNHTTIEVDNPFRVRTLGTMRQFKGIEGIDC